MANAGTSIAPTVARSSLTAGCITELHAASRTAIGAGAGVTGGTSPCGGTAAIPGGGIESVADRVIEYDVEKRIRQLCEQATGSGVAVSTTDNGQSILLTMQSNVKLGTDPYVLTQQFRAKLDKIAQTLNAHPDSLIDVYGHTVSIGSLQRNQAVSEQRARTVAEYLSTRGVNPARIRCCGFGATKPLADNATPQGRAQNRRVEIKIVPVAQDRMGASRREGG